MFTSRLHNPRKEWEAQKALLAYTDYMKDSTEKNMNSFLILMYPLIEIIINKEFYMYLEEDQEDLFCEGVKEAFSHIKHLWFIPGELVSWHFSQYFYTSIKRAMISAVRILILFKPTIEEDIDVYRHKPNDMYKKDCLMNLEFSLYNIKTSLFKRYRLDIKYYPAFKKITEHILETLCWPTILDPYYTSLNKKEVKFLLDYVKVLVRFELKTYKGVNDIFSDTDDMFDYYQTDTDQAVVDKS